MVVEHIVRVGAATGLPFFVCCPPVEDVGTPLTTEITLQALERLALAARGSRAAGCVRFA